LSLINCVQNVLVDLPNCLGTPALHMTSLNMAGWLGRDPPDPFNLLVPRCISDKLSDSLCSVG
jgi:hypothetical protein